MANFRTYGKTESQYLKKPTSNGKIFTADEIIARKKKIEDERRLEIARENFFKEQERRARLDEVNSPSNQTPQVEEEKKKANPITKIADTFIDLGGLIGGAALNSIPNALRSVETGYKWGVDKLGEGLDKIAPKGSWLARQTDIMQMNDPVTNMLPNPISKSGYMIDRQFGVSEIDKGGDFLKDVSYNADDSYIRDLKPGTQDIVYGVSEAVGEMLPSIAIGNVAGSTASLTTMGMGAFQSGYEQAIDEGGNFDEAVGYGSLNAAKEVITEKIVGGGFEKLTGVTGIADNVVSKIPSKLLRTGVEILGEGFEEAIAEGIDPYLKRMTYDKNADKATMEDMIKAGIIGSLTAGVFQGANVVIRKSTNADTKEIINEYNNLTKYEQSLLESGITDQKTLNELKEKKAELEAQMQLKLDKMNELERIGFVTKFGNQSSLFENYDPMAFESKVTRDYMPKVEENAQLENVTKENIREEVVETPTNALEETTPKIADNLENTSNDNNITPSDINANTSENKGLNIQTKPITPTKKVKGESKHLSTVIESSKDYANQELQDTLKQIKLDYDVKTNKETVEKAKASITSNNTEAEIESTLRNLEKVRKANEESEVLIAKAHLLYQVANKKGMNQQAVDIATSLSTTLTQLGRGVQAASIIQRLSPEGKLLYRQKQQKSITDEMKKRRKDYRETKAYKQVVKERTEKYYNSDLRLLKKKYTNNFLESNNIKLDEALQKRLANLTTTSQNYLDNVKKVFDEIKLENSEELAKNFSEEMKKQEVNLEEEYKNNPVVIPYTLVDQLINTTSQSNADEIANKIEKIINEQRTATLFEKTMQWRYLAMLGNPKTHIRNFASNAVMREVVDLSNFVSRSLQRVLVKEENRTRTFKATSSQMKIYSKEVANLTIKELSETTSKYQEANKLNKVFNTKLFEVLRKFNFLALEKGDYVFMEDRFSRELGEWATAKGYTVEQLKSNPKLLEQGKVKALETSLKATFRDTCGLVTWLNSIKAKSKIAELALGAVIPFTKTPINIARRAIDYSPVGIVKTVAKNYKNLKSGKMGAGEFIDEISKGLTGTGIMLLGYFLASMGIINGGRDENEKASKYEQQIGKQNYSVKIGDKTYTLDWLAPSSIPFFSGVTLYDGVNRLTNDDEKDNMAFIGAITSLLDPMTEMSFMQSFNNILSSYEDNKITGVVENSFQSYIAQFFPTVGSQIAKTFDDTRRTTYASGTGYTKKVNSTINFLKSKVPFLATTLEPYVNVWGEVEKDTQFENRLLENSVYPFWISNNTPTNVDKEIMRLYTEYGNTDILPSIPSAKYTIDNKDIYLTEEEYTNYKIEVGKFSHEQLEEIFASQFYQELTDEEKEKVIKKVYDYSREYAKKNKEYLLYKALKNKGKNLSKYLIELNNITSVDGIYGSKKDQVKAYIEAQNLTKAQKYLLFGYADYKNSLGKDEVINYLNTLDLSKEEVDYLLKITNYS